MTEVLWVHFSCACGESGEGWEALNSHYDMCPRRDERT